MKVIEVLREKCTPKIRQIAYLVVTAWVTLFGFLLLFVPFCQILYASGDVFLKPYMGFTLLKDELAAQDGSAYIGLALFGLWAVYMGFALRGFLRVVLHFRGDEEKIQTRVKRLCIFHTSCTGGYYVGSLVFVFVNKALGGASYSVSNVWPFICVLVMDLLFALFLGVVRVEREEKERKTIDPRRKTLQKRKWETFLYATLLLACALLTFFTKIVDVTFIGTNERYKDYDFSMTGIDVLKHYAELEEASQILAFVLFLALALVLTAYFLTTVALLSKSHVFFQFSMISIVTSCLGCFLIGMYGKYYQMTQSLNVDALVTWLEYKVAELGLPSLSFGELGEAFLESYEIKSYSFYFFIGAMVIVGVLLVRRSYSKGIALAKELDPAPYAMTAKIEKAELDIHLENDDERNPAPSVLSANDGVGGEEPSINVDPCPAFTELDALSKNLLTEVQRKKETANFDEPTLPKLVQFIVQYARDSRLHLFYTAEDVATFIAGLGTTKLSILQGMSGTGKTSLPKIFSEALFSQCDIIEVESAWRDKNELLGYYNEFSKAYTPKKFTQALYAASLNPETLTFIVLDEMNLSRIEYYFSDFLSLMENEPDKREIKLLNVGLFCTEKGKKRAYKGLTRGHTIKIPPNVWFIGTANRDESTFEISDKVYDRAHTMNFNKRAKKVRCYNEPLPQKFLPASVFNELLEEAKKTVAFNVEEYPVIGEVEKLLAPYNISFGNRIAMQIESFVAIYCACFTVTDEVIHDAVERILLTKVVSKLELKSVENKEELAAAFEGLGLLRCSEFISKLNED